METELREVSINETFEFLTVRSKVENRQTFICECKCGNSVNVDRRHLLSGNRTSCGCKGRIKYKELVGKKYSELTVLGDSPIKDGNLLKILCECVCGTKKLIGVNNLLGGKSTSCGCKNHRGELNGSWKGYKELTGRFFSRIQRGAIKRNLKYEIDIVYSYDLFISQNKKCALTGIDIIIPTHRDDTSFTASLDRIDSSLGYIKGNVQWVHKDINMMKNSHIQDHFIKLCKLVAEHNP